MPRSRSKEREERVRRVRWMLIQGYNDKEIAQELGSSPESIRLDISTRIYLEEGVKSRSQLIFKHYQGLIALLCNAHVINLRDLLDADKDGEQTQPR